MPSASSPSFTAMVVCLPPAGLPAKRWSCRCATGCSLAEALSISLSLHADGGRTLSLIERRSFSLPVGRDGGPLVPQLEHLEDEWGRPLRRSVCFTGRCVCVV